METINKIIIQIPIMLIKLYRVLVSPVIGPSCRLTPTCSEYSIQAFRKHGFLKGGYLTVKRLFSCRPGGRHGYDPVPDDRSNNE